MPPGNNNAHAYEQPRSEASRWLLLPEPSTQSGGGGTPYGRARTPAEPSLLGDTALASSRPSSKTFRSKASSVSSQELPLTSASATAARVTPGPLATPSSIRPGKSASMVRKVSATFSGE